MWDSELRCSYFITLAPVNRRAKCALSADGDAQSKLIRPNAVCLRSERPRQMVAKKATRQVRKKSEAWAELVAGVAVARLAETLGWADSSATAAGTTTASWAWEEKAKGLD